MINAREDLSAHLSVKEKSKETIATYDAKLKLFDQYLREECALSDGIDQPELITREMADSYHRSLKEKKLSPVTRNVHVAALRAFFDRNYTMGRMKDRVSPVLSYAAVPNNPRTSTRLPFTDQEILDMLHVCDGRRTGVRDKALIVTFLATALRASSMSALNVSDLPAMKDGSVVVSVKGKGEDIAAVVPFCILLIEKYVFSRKKVEADSPLFMTQKHTRLDRKAMHDIISQIQQVAGINRTGLHLFRHTTIQRVYDISPRIARDVALHSYRNMTERYANTNCPERIEAIKMAYEKISKNFFLEDR